VNTALSLSEILFYLELLKKGKRNPSLSHLRMMLCLLDNYEQVKEVYNKLDELKLKIPVIFYSDSLIHFIEDSDDCISLRNMVLPKRDKRRKNGYSILFIQQILLSKSKEQAIIIINEAKQYGIHLADTWANHFDSMWEIKRDQGEYRKNIICYEYNLNLEMFEEFNKVKYKYFSNISSEQLKQILIEKQSNINTRKVTQTSVFERSLCVKEFARRGAGGICQLCDEKAPFIDKQGIPFLEIHHIHYLSKGGSDSVDNVIALCPNCHRKIHILELEEDVKKIKEKALEKIKI
jgi:5-methylcytosine-specific restriction endonuclease McrA